MMLMSSQRFFKTWIVIFSAACDSVILASLGVVTCRRQFETF